MAVQCTFGSTRRSPEAVQWSLGFRRRGLEAVQRRSGSEYAADIIQRGSGFRTFAANVVQRACGFRRQAENCDMLYNVNAILLFYRTVYLVLHNRRGRFFFCCSEDESPRKKGRTVMDKALYLWCMGSIHCIWLFTYCRIEEQKSLTDLDQIVVPPPFTGHIFWCLQKCSTRMLSLHFAHALNKFVCNVKPHTGK